MNLLLTHYGCCLVWNHPCPCIVFTHAIRSQISCDTGYPSILVWRMSFWIDLFVLDIFIIAIISSIVIVIYIHIYIMFSSVDIYVLPPLCWLLVHTFCPKLPIPYMNLCLYCLPSACSLYFYAKVLLVYQSDWQLNFQHPRILIYYFCYFFLLLCYLFNLFVTETFGKRQIYWLQANGVFLWVKVGCRVRIRVMVRFKN